MLPFSSTHIAPYPWDEQVDVFPHINVDNVANAGICHQHNGISIHPPKVLDGEPRCVWVVLCEHTQLDPCVTLQRFHFRTQTTLLKIVVVGGGGVWWGVLLAISSPHLAIGQKPCDIDDGRILLGQQFWLVYTLEACISTTCKHERCSHGSNPALYKLVCL